MRTRLRRLLASGLLVLLFAAVAGVHVHTAAAKGADDACLACKLATGRAVVEAPAVAHIPDSTPAVEPFLEALPSRPALPDHTGRSPPRSPAA